MTKKTLKHGSKDADKAFGRMRKVPDGTLVLPPDMCCETVDERIVDLRSDGIDCIPVLERLRRKSMMEASTSAEHVHDGCVEIVFCQRGELTVESMGVTCPFRPGMVFVSRPDEPHRLSAFPRGMSIYSMLFAVIDAATVSCDISTSDQLTHVVLIFAPIQPFLLRLTSLQPGHIFPLTISPGGSSS